VCEGGDEQCRGTVLADSDNESDTDDSDDDVQDTDDGSSALITRLLRRRRTSPKHHGTVQVLWTESDSEPSRMRVGRDGSVDVWCLDAAPGGQYYRDHLGVLDGSLMSTGDCNDEDDSDDEVWVPTYDAVADTIPTRTPLGTSSIFHDNCMHHSLSDADANTCNTSYTLCIICPCSILTSCPSIIMF